MLTVQFTVSAHALFKSIKEAKLTKAALQGCCISENFLVYQLLVGIQAGVAGVLLQPIVTLLALHVVLRIRNISTYQFIVMQRELVQLEELNTVPRDKASLQHTRQLSMWWRKHTNPQIADTSLSHKRKQRSIGLSPIGAWKIHALLDHEQELSNSLIQPNIPKQKQSTDQKADVKSKDSYRGTGDKMSDVEGNRPTRNGLFGMHQAGDQENMYRNKPAVKLPPLKIDTVLDVSRETSLIRKARPELPKGISIS